MNIALIGYGKMGHAIEEVATKRGHTIIAIINSGNRDLLTNGELRDCDVAIEFTAPEIAKENVVACLKQGINVVSGTTGWNDEIGEAQSAAIDNNRGLLHASNFSIGVNIFFEVNKLLASLMNGQPEYDITIEETHHIHKKDAPSGTAITLAEQILHCNEHKKAWSLNFLNNPNILPIVAHRIDNVPGTHVVKYHSEIDDLVMTHTAHNRDGFALGAVLAAEFLFGKAGVFTMQDVLGIKR